MLFRFVRSILFVAISIGATIKDVKSEVHPLGVVIRPNLLKKVISEFNHWKSENRGIDINLCVNGRFFGLSLMANWTDPKWLNLSPDRLYFETKISNFKAIGKTFEGCSIDESTKQIRFPKAENPKALEASVDIQEGQFGFYFYPQSMTLRADRTVISKAVSSLSIQIKNSAGGTEFLNTGGIREAFLIQILELAQSSISSWLKEKLRGLSFAQSAGEVLKDNPIWRAGVLVENGAFTMELAERSPSQQFLTFAFNPFKRNSAFSTNNGLELYFNADFLNMDQLRNLSGLNPTAENSSQVLERTKFAISNPALWSDSEFEHPNLSPSSGDFSLVIPTNLMNHALSNFYRERLLKLRTKVNIGQQTKGLLSDEVQDVHYLVTISPQSAPQMSFQANNFKLEVENYVMELNTWIEDRAIPTTQIATQVSIGAAIGIDPQRHIVRMTLDSNQFELKLKDLKDRFTPDEILLFQNMAITIWRDFLKNYADFEIFPTVIDTGNIPLEVQRVSVTGSSVVLDMNVLLRGAIK